MTKKLTEKHRNKISNSLKGNTNALKTQKIQIGNASVNIIEVEKKLMKLEDPFEESKIDVIQPPYSLVGFGAYFEKNEYNSIACKFKTNAVVGQGYEIQDVGIEQRDKDTEYEKLKLFLENPNPRESFQSIIRKFWLDYEIYGNAYLEIDEFVFGNNKGKLKAIGHIPAQTIRKAGGKKKGYYQLRMNTTKVKYFDDYNNIDSMNFNDINKPVTQILHLKNYYPDSSYYGMPDVLPALGAMYLDLQLVTYNVNFFQNNAMPEGALVFTNTRVDEKLMAQIQDYFKRELKGNTNSRRTMILSGEGPNAKIEFIPLGNEKDLSFENLHKMTRDRVLTAHQIPPKVAGVVSAGELGQSNAEYAQMQNFQELTINPKQDQIEFLLNRLFRDKLGITKWRLKFKEFDYTPNAEDIKNTIDLLDAGIIDENEARQRLNLPKKDNNETITEEPKVEPTTEEPQTQE